MSCGADTEANTLMQSLLEGESFELPDIDLTDDRFNFPGGADGALYQAVNKIEISDLTTRTVGGAGVFDALMESFSNHLKSEYEKGRITGAEYTKAYTALTESAMNQSVGFLLGKDQAFWQAQAAQLQAFTARVQLEAAKVQLVAQRIEANNQKANYALTKVKLANESTGYCTALFNLENILPQQLTNLIGQHGLISEQMEAQRGQTSDQRSDGTVVSGVMGKQKLLYAQQITSYQRDAEVKAAKMFTDAWITQKTLDEGLVPPSGFTNASLDTVLTKLKINNGLT